MAAAGAAAGAAVTGGSTGAIAAAAGLASTNKLPIVNTYGMFASMRALEMLRTAICLNNANVKIVSSHCGLDVGQDGPCLLYTSDAADE